MSFHVTLWLQVGNGTEQPDEHTMRYDLWTRNIITGSVPLVGDEIILWPDEDYSATSGPMWEVRRRYLDWAGRWHCEMTRMVIDPSEQIQQSILRGPYEPTRYAGSWWTANDGDPTVGLRRGSWKPYGEDIRHGGNGE